MFKKATVVMLSTNEKANIYKAGSLLYRYNEGVNRFPSNCINYQLYIVYDEEIKEDDWYHDDFNNTIIHANPNSDHKYYVSNCHKIIASTNYNLNLPQPSQSFIDKYITEYNKGNIITDIMVEYEEVVTCPENIYRDHTPIKLLTTICSQCVITYDLKVNPKDNTITIKRIKNSWTREEMVSLVASSWLLGAANGDYTNLPEAKEEFDNFLKDI